MLVLNLQNSNQEGKSFLHEKYRAQDSTRLFNGNLNNAALITSSNEKSVFNSPSQRSIWVTDLNRIASSVNVDFNSPSFVESQTSQQQVNLNESKQSSRIK